MKFADLAWEDLEEWAGNRVVTRAKSYQRRVEDLRIIGDGTLLAWVEGGDRYATLAKIDGGGKLSSKCTCPYSWGPCKHAVAVILAYLATEQSKQKTPKAEMDDERLALLARVNGDMDDEDSTDSGLIDIPQESKEDDPVRKHLENLSKTQLVNLLLEGRNVIPELRQQISDRKELQAGNVAKLIASARREIQNASRDPGWTNHWRGESSIPDYSRVKQRLEYLLAAGQADAVVDLGSYLMECGTEQVGQSNDEGETGMEIAGTMDVVFKAVMRSSLSVSQRLLWEIDQRLKDDYGILDGLKGPLDATSKPSKADWSRVVDVLAVRLDELPLPAGERDAFSSKYKREQLMKWLLLALEHAGRNDEVIPILERETIRTQCYVELVEKLIKSGHVDKARDWAKKGFLATQKSLPGISWRLEEQLRELSDREKDLPMVAAYRVMEFFKEPGLSSYSEVEKAASKAGVWDVVRPLILTYLKTGHRPDTPLGSVEIPAQRKKGKSTKVILPGAAQLAWPLPLPDLPATEPRWTRFPDISTLTDIAIKEGRLDDALSWYRQGRHPNTHDRDYKGAEVAQAVAKTHPDDAITIWKDLVSKELVHACPAAYQTAGGYLAKIRDVWVRTERTSEWNAYLAVLRQQNNRRPRMLDVLNSMEGRRTRIVRQ